MPEIAPALADAAEVFPRAVQTQLTIKRGASERIYNIRVTSRGRRRGHEFRRDARRHHRPRDRAAQLRLGGRGAPHRPRDQESLDPIQLSAERLKRKYGKLIQTDREIFDQCTDTIVRQVDDIKRMVDEFSTFARMPRLAPSVPTIVRMRAPDRLSDAGRQRRRRHHRGPSRRGAFTRRSTGGSSPRRCRTREERDRGDRRARGIGRQGEAVRIALKRRDGMAQLDVIDNGKGFPAANRQRLLEPYMTTRAEGTGSGLPDRRQNSRRSRRLGWSCSTRPPEGARVCAFCCRSSRREAAPVGSDKTKALSSEVGGA